MLKLTRSLNARGLVILQSPQPLSGTKMVTPPRARGDVHVSVKPLGARTVLDRFRQAGSLKLLFPRMDGTALQGALVNTAGGVTGGDDFDFCAEAQTGTDLTLTTQAAERAYRAQPGQAGIVQNTIAVKAGARVDWLPQETILFEGCSLRRRLQIDVQDDARLLVCEPLVFGRAAMGETLHDVQWSDRISIRKDDGPLFEDAMAFEGDLTAHLARPTIAHGAGAMANLVYTHVDAEAYLSPLRAAIGDAGGVSLIHPTLIFARVLAPDSFALRKILIPMLTRLAGRALPRPWML